MTQTRRSGIRLPWSHEDEAEDAPMTGASEASDQPAEGAETGSPEEAQVAAAQATESPTAADAAPAGTPEETPMSAEDNELLSSLITAMREVAERERASKVAGLSTAVDEAIERMKTRAADEAARLRERADLDVAGIAEWVRAETERIEAEGRSKTDARRTQLTDQLAENDRRSESRMEAVRSRVAEYETQLATFFAELDAINDPAVFGTAAKRMPRPPTLDVPGEPPTAVTPALVTPVTPASVPETPDETTAPGGAVPTDAAAEAVAQDTVPAESDQPAEPTEPAAPAAQPAVADAPEASSEEPEAPVAPAETLRDRMDALGIEREPATETAHEGEPATETADQPDADTRVSDASGLAARLAQLDARIGAAGTPETPATTVASPGPTGETATAIMVSGLGSFGAITSFKQALERVDGVHGISLSLGPTGEFVYRATHAAEFDLATAIEQIERGTAKIDRQADGSLRVTVQRTR